MRIWQMVVVMTLMLSSAQVLANCQLSSYRGPCELPVKEKPVAYNRSLVYCGNTPMYVNQAEYDLLVRYQRVNTNMILTLNGEYITSPCIPAGRNGVN